MQWELVCFWNRGPMSGNHLSLLWEEALLPCHALRRVEANGPLVTLAPFVPAELMADHNAAGPRSCRGLGDGMSCFPPCHGGQLCPYETEFLGVAGLRMLLV